MPQPKLPSAFHLRPAADQARYIENSLNYHVGPDGGETITIGPDLELLVRLDDFVRLSLEADLPPFRIDWKKREKRMWDPDAPGREYPVQQPASVRIVLPNSGCSASEKLADLLRSFVFAAVNIFGPSEWDANANQLLYAPHLRLLRDVFLCDPINARLNCCSSALDDRSRTLEEIYNDFGARFRQAFLTKKPQLLRDLHNWGWGTHENVENVHTYLDGLFARHRSLSVMHLRLFHARERVNLITAPVENLHRDLADLRACRGRLFDRMRRKRSLFTDDPAYVWSILPSLVGGYSLYLSLLFDTVALGKVVADGKAEAELTGEVLRDHADQIGAYWVMAATGGQGSYLRADQNTWLYGPDWVHGEVRADDLERRQTLARTLSCLAMRRALIRLKSEPAGQYFRMRDRKVHAPRRSRKDGEQLLRRR